MSDEKFPHTGEKFRCTGCGRKRMAHPNNECADCYLAGEVLAGRQDRQYLYSALRNQPDRILFIDSLLRKFGAVITIQVQQEHQMVALVIDVDAEWPICTIDGERRSIDELAGFPGQRGSLQDAVMDLIAAVEYIDQIDAPAGLDTFDAK